MRKRKYARGLACVLALSLAAGSAMPAAAQTQEVSLTAEAGEEGDDSEKENVEGKGRENLDGETASSDKKKGQEDKGEKPFGETSLEDTSGNDEREEAEKTEEPEDETSIEIKPQAGKPGNTRPNRVSLTATSSNAVKRDEPWDGDYDEIPDIGSSRFTSWFFRNTDNELLWEFVLSLMEDENHEFYEDFMEWYQTNEKRVSKAYEEFFGIELYSSSVGDLWKEWNAEMDFEGSGTSTNPYQIESLSELMGLSERVAAGENFQGKYFELRSDIDLGNLDINSGCWNPIGWYQNKADLDGSVRNVFKGHFDGGGHTISGLKFTKTDENYSNLGLFGVIEDAVIENLTVEAYQVSGEDNIAILAGEVRGDSQIKNVSVSGEVYAQGDAGGIAGQVTGKSGKNATLENCTAESVVVNSEGRNDYVGGIAGNVQYADLVDNSVSTSDGDTDRIQGKGYVGGIAGRINKANIYNSYVSGTIGGNQSAAVGGILGLYESGNLVVARFDGEVGRTNQGTSSHEGTFVGTREGRSKFTYGTGAKDNLSFLFATDAALAKNVFGSNLDNDNAFTEQAHIGYFTDYGVKYTTVAGTKEIPCEDRYFYEELEDGIRYIITQKLGRDMTVDFAKGLDFEIDHFAPGYQGEPIRGYLVSIPRIDEYEAKGAPDTDVAVLTAIGRTNNSFYRRIDKDHPSAVAPGDVISVTTAPKNKNGNRYQMVYDEFEEGNVLPPTYLDEEGEPQPMAYENGGSYTFQMPESATELNVKYIKVTTELSMDPEETTIAVKQTRSGDRKNPDIITEVFNENGKLIARYINGKADESVQITPVTIHAEHNGEGSSHDQTVKWSVDDTDLLENQSEDGWTQSDARIIPNMNSQFINDIINSEVQKQADNGYRTPISNTIYEDYAVVTASTNPETSVDNKEVVGNTKVIVTFQIIDNTQLKVEGINLNHTKEVFTITRKLTGDRKNPVETYTVDNAAVLSATIFPSGSFYKNVSWSVSDTDGGKAIQLTPKGANTQECEVKLLFTETGTGNPGWIQDVIDKDNAAKAADNGYRKIDGSRTETAVIVAESEDQTYGQLTAECEVTIHFVTVDETVVHPEGVELNKTELEYPVSYHYEGDLKSDIKAKNGFGDKDTLTATVMPDISDSDVHRPYDREVVWTSSDENALSVEDGKLTVNDHADWITDALKEAPYSAEKTVTVTAKTVDGENAGSCDVTLKFHAEAIEADRESEAFEIVLTKTGSRNNPTFEWAGNERKKLNAEIFTEKQGLSKVWSTTDASVLTVDPDGNIIPVVTDSEGKVIAEWISTAMKKSPYEASRDVVITAAASDHSMQDKIPVNLNFKMIDKTYSSSGGSSGGSGGGGGGGSSSSGVTPGGSVKTTVTGGPAGYVTGTWVQDAQGNWLFTGNGRTYTNEWAYIHNPYASKEQSSTDWFRFDESGHMVTGWYQNSSGDWYYLNPVSDNTLGRMLTGWNFVDGAWRYFNTTAGDTFGKLLTGWNWLDGNGDGTAECYYLDPNSKGQMMANGQTPDGYYVDAEGHWIVDGVVQTKTVR